MKISLFLICVGLMTVSCQESCQECKTITEGEWTGTYRLKEKDSKVCTGVENLVDACLYEKDGLEYCFLNGGPTIENDCPGGESTNTTKPSQPGDTTSTFKPDPDYLAKLGCIQEKNTAYTGNNVKKHTGINSKEECAQLCNYNKDCKFWASTPAKGLCNLKASTKGKEKAGGITAGNKKCGNPDIGCFEMKNFAYDGNNVKQISNINSKEECAKLCWEKKNCLFWTLNETTQICNLKSETNQKKDKKTGRISGSKGCGNPNYSG